MKDIPSTDANANNTIKSSLIDTNNRNEISAQRNDDNKVMKSLDDSNHNNVSTGNDLNLEFVSSIIRDTLSAGKAVRKSRNTSTPTRKVDNDTEVLSKSTYDESPEMINSQMTSSSASDADSTEMSSSQTETPMPDWVVVGESVLIRPYNTSGVISFIGPTHFQVSES